MRSSLPLGIPPFRSDVLQGLKCGIEDQILEVGPGIVVRTLSKLSKVNTFRSFSSEVYFEDRCISFNTLDVGANTGMQPYRPSRCSKPGTSTSIRRGNRRRIASSRSNGRFVAPMTTMRFFLLVTALFKPSISCMNCVNMDR